jgi:hypothetical protein
MIPAWSLPGYFRFNEVIAGADRWFRAPRSGRMTLPCCNTGGTTAAKGDTLDRTIVANPLASEAMQPGPIASR